MPSASILILSLLGIAITAYITAAHLLKKKVMCPISSKSCNIVLDSKYSRTFGVKNEIIGLAYYIMIFFAFLQSISLDPFILKTISGLAALYSIILFGIQVKKLKNYCSWCITTAIINILLFVLIISQF
jgi:uncharacterized membrane protein